MKFKNECDKLGGAPACFTGFCDDYAECIDCPSGLVDRVIIKFKLCYLSFGSKFCY
jgi:hypothetical protein